jgi:hypothetical protein
MSTSLLERFPRARAVATPDVVKAMHEHPSPDRIESFWRRLFPGEIPDRLLVAESLEEEELEHCRDAAIPSRFRPPERSNCERA